MRNLLFVARREVRTQLRRWTFYLATFGMPLLLGLVFLGISLVGKLAGTDSLQRSITGQSGKPVGLVDQSAIIATLPPQFVPIFQGFPDEQSAAEALRSSHIDAYFVVHADYRQTGQVDRVSRQASFLNVQSYNVQSLTALLQANLIGDTVLAQRINQPANFATTIVSTGGDQAAGSTLDQTRGQRPALTSGLSSGFAYLLAFSLLSGGGLLLSAITEEKSNRTIELLLTSLKPWQLLAGKLVGLGLVGLIQLTIWLGIGQTILRGAQTIPGAAPLATSAVAAIPPTLWLWIVVFFLLGYLLYGTLMALLAGLGTSARESGQISTFLTLPVLLPVLFFSVISDQPNGVIARVLSFFPLTAPTTLMLRLGVGQLPAWELALAIGVLLLSIIGAMALAARLFRASTLLTGTRPTPRALLRALRNA
ncbi:MAG: ABC transporter permease [Herpetosiphonaceae bacterium]|nr:ABC transporter permease [Herpetosiphonaceae bacterium]